MISFNPPPPQTTTLFPFFFLTLCPKQIKVQHEFKLLNKLKHRLSVVLSLILHLFLTLQNYNLKLIKKVLNT